MMRSWIRQSAGAGLVLALTLLPFSGRAASVKPLEMVTEKILRLEVERLAAEHILAVEMVRRSLERLNKELNITSPERITVSLRLLSDSRDAYSASVRSAVALSGYVGAYRSQLKNNGHEIFLPLARLNDEIEKAYNAALDKFLVTSTQFVQYCGDNLDAVSTGQPEETKHYDALYATYLRDMEAFNSQSMKRSQLLGDWTALYPALLEFLPR